MQRFPGDLFLVILSIVSPVSVVEAVHDSLFLKCIMVSERLGFIERSIMSEAQ